VIGGPAGQVQDEHVRRIGVIAAALALVLTFGALAVRAANRPGGRILHSCTATDQSFIQTASVDVTALGGLASELKAGAVAPQAVAREAFDAAERVSHVAPKDPSLREAQRYLSGMFSEYGAAVVLLAKGKDASARMHRAYGLANFAREVLAEAQPALHREGCDVGPLL
jgi:hypothetical protein